MARVTETGDHDIYNLYRQYGFDEELASSATSYLDTMNRLKQSRERKSLTALWMAHTKHNQAIDLHDLCDRIGCGNVKLQPQEGKIVIHTALSYVDYYIESGKLELSPEIEERARDIAARVDEGEGLPVLAPDAAAAILRQACLDSGFNMKKDNIARTLRRPIVSISNAVSALDRWLAPQ
jgi:hypothetical protein